MRFKLILPFLTILGGLVSGCAGGGNVTAIQQEVDVLRSRLSAVQKEQMRLRKEIDALRKGLEASRTANADLFLKLEKTARQAQFLQDRLEDSRSRTSFGNHLDSDGGNKGFNSSRKKGASRQIFDAAYQDFVKGQDQIAAAGFKRFLAVEPQSPLSDDAAYWLAVIDFSHQRFAEAIEQFKSLLVNYPDGDKAPVAMLKIGYAYLMIEQRKTGAEWLERLVRRFPFSAEAALAKARLVETQR